MVSPTICGSSRLPGPSKVKVTYKARSLSAEENGQREDATAPVVGKSYVVTRDGPNVVVDGGDGQSVAAEEVAIVAKDSMKQAASRPNPPLPRPARSTS